MLVCPRCGYYNSDVATSCDQCRAALSSADRERRQPRASESAVTVEENTSAAEQRVCPGCGATTKTRFCPHCGRQLFGEPTYAGFWIRGGALMIDSLLVIVAMLLVLALVPLGVLGLTLLALGPAIYEISFEAKTGATLGKKALGLRVVTPDLQPLGLGRSIGRHLAHYVSGFFLGGYLMVVFNRQKRALHDYLAGTIVVKER